MFKSFFHFIVLISFVLGLFVVVPPAPVYAAGEIVVNSDADVVANDGTCTLREAIQSANTDFPSGNAAGECAASSGADTITFAGNYTITLGSQLPVILTDITINGNGNANTIVQAHALPNTATDRILYVNGGNVTINGMTLRNGRCSGGCIGIFSNSAGGVMIANGSFTLQDSNLEGNHASQGGGALFIYSANASATILNSSVSNNSSGDVAGGIFMNQGTLIVENSVIDSNNTVSTGGGLYTLNASVTVENSIFSGNSSVTGGGAFLSNGTTAAFSEVTFSGNNATSNGGGLQSQTGSLDLTNVTFDGNSVTSATSARGGGLYISNNSPILSNVIFSGNTVTGIAGTHGGGMYSEQASPVMNQVVFSNNTADGPINNSFGGGLSIIQGSPIIENATFIENSSAFKGGGLYSNGSNMTVINTSFEMNITIDGGGVYLDTGSPTLENVLFRENTATSKGGGLYMFADADINTTTFDSNEAIYGGGIYSISNFNAIIRNSLFKSNTAIYGGGVLNHNANTAFTNLTFHGNNGSSYGGGMYNYLSSPSLMNTTFSANNATHGGAMFNDGNSDPTVTNSIFWSNTYNEIYVYDVASAPVVTYSIVQGGYTGAGNLNLNPHLGELKNNGGLNESMALNLNSPAINSGTNVGCPSTDQRGVARPQSAHCDIGAYEKIDASSFPTFADVPTNGFAWAHIESIYMAGITVGCSVSPLNYCPNGTVTRAQMAVFLMKGIHGSAYTPPPATGTVFNDVPMGSFAAAFIEAFANEGITGGCGNGNFCPSGLVTRAQMAVFLLKAKHGAAYTPPAATGTMFNDVPSNAFAVAWIEQLATEGITGGCGGGNYCPNNSVTRAQMAVFLQKTFNLPLP